MLRPILLIVMFCIVPEISAQAKFSNNKDSLESKTYEYLQLRIDNSQTDLEPVYIKAHLHKAKREQNQKQLFQGYKNMLFTVEDFNSRIRYCDSMIAIAQKAHDGELLASAHLTRGAIFYSKKNYAQALDNYVKADKFVSEIYNPYLSFKVQYCIAQVRHYLGQYPEAIALLKGCANYYKGRDGRAYLNSLHLLGLSYCKSNQFELCGKTNQLGLSQVTQLNEPDMVHYFIHSEGVNQFFLGNYDACLQYLRSTISFLIEQGDFANEAVAHFYIARSYQKLGQKQKMILNLEKVKGILTFNNYLRPDLIDTYRLLNEHYKSENNIPKQLDCINGMLKADSLLYVDHQNVAHTLYRSFDTKALRVQKQKLQDALASKQQLGFVVYLFSWIFGVTILVALSWYFINKKKKHKEIEKSTEKADDVLPDKGRSPGIKDEVIAILLRRLEKFEARKKYLEKDMNLNRMAELLDTNSKYVSLLIHECRHKKTTEYLNDLKIDHLVGKLQEDKKFRSYNYKALATEIGYSTTTSLQKAFVSRMKVSLNEYIENLQSDGSANFSGVHEDPSYLRTGNP